MKTDFVSTNENFKKSLHLFTLLFYTLLITYCYAKECLCATNLLQLYVVLLLLNVMFPSELCQ